jgi:hypothetical protein
MIPNPMETVKTAIIKTITVRTGTPEGPATWVIEAANVTGGVARYSYR